MLEEIRHFFSLPYEVHLLFPIFHGNKDGLWQLSPESRRLTFHDVIQQWESAKRAGHARHLDIIADCCSSGVVVHDAARRGQRDIFVQSACGVGGRDDASDEPGNTFTEKWIKQQKLHFSDYLMKRNVHKLSNCGFGGPRMYYLCYWLPNCLIQWAVIGAVESHHGERPSIHFRIWTAYVCAENDQIFWHGRPRLCGGWISVCSFV